MEACGSVKTEGMYISPHNDVMARSKHFRHCEQFLAHTMKPPPPTNGGPWPSD
jgi:hypothetical protein